MFRPAEAYTLPANLWPAGNVETNRGLTDFIGAPAFCQAGDLMTPDEIQIRSLNDPYLEAFLKAAVNWYQASPRGSRACRAEAHLRNRGAG